MLERRACLLGVHACLVGVRACPVEVRACPVEVRAYLEGDHASYVFGVQIDQMVVRAILMGVHAYQKKDYHVGEFRA